MISRISSGTRKYLICKAECQLCANGTISGFEVYIIAPHVNLWQSEESISFWICLHHLLQSQVHPVVAVDEVTIERFAILELDEHWVTLRGHEET